MEQFHILTPEREDRLITSSVDANYNAYATLKLSYTFEYGKKVGRSPKYQTVRGESTIIEGRY